MRNALQPPKQNEATHWPALDGLRACAACAVLVEHVYQEYASVKWLVPGYFGVRLFFVLSGFLITGILLKSRNDNGERLPLGHALKVFYVRRSLRIFPIYYLTLLVMMVFSNWVNGLQGAHLWRLTYLTNFHMAIHNTGDTYYGHLWTLAVEEQFYLIWPFVILCLPRRWLLPVVLFVVLLGPIGRMVAAVAGLNDFWIRKPTWACFDSLGTGALLAIFRWQRIRVPCPRWLLGSALALTLILVMAVLQARSEWGERSLVVAASLGFVEAPILVFFVATCASERAGHISTLMSWKPLQTLGRRSYGFYLYHAFLMAFVSLGFRSLQIQQKSGIGLHAYFVVVLLCSLGAAFLSWRLIEAPLSQIKERFAYGK